MFSNLKKSAASAEYRLVFAGSKSNFYHLDQLGSDKDYIGPNVFDRGLFFTDMDSNSILKEESFNTKDYIISIPSLSWKILGDQKKTIFGYECLKAIAEEEFYSIRQQKMLTFEVVAWFTPSINMSAGPLQYSGLPGLVMHVEANGGIYNVKEMNLDKKVSENQLVNFDGESVISLNTFHEIKSEVIGNSSFK